MNLSAFPGRHICAVYFLCIADNGHSCIGDICYGSGTAPLLHCSFIAVMDGQLRPFLWAEQKKKMPRIKGQSVFFIFSGSTKIAEGWSDIKSRFFCEEAAILCPYAATVVYNVHLL